jgi:DNA primase catalytic subunit
MLRDGRFVKLNRFENRLTEKDLKVYCWKLKPMHVFFSILNWLFPERVGKKYKARYCVPLNGEYVIDVDSYLMPFTHKHKVDDHWYVCPYCLEMSRRLTLQLCEIIRQYYREMAVVFSRCQGFHVHVLDFDYHDWVPYRERDQIWCHQAARFKFTRLLQKQAHVFDRVHFTVSVDPMRVVTVPNTINGKTGLICRFIGSPKDLEKLTITQVIGMSKTFLQSCPEPLESPLATAKGTTGAMKTRAKNFVGARAWGHLPDQIPIFAYSVDASVPTR